MNRTIYSYTIARKSERNQRIIVRCAEATDPPEARFFTVDACTRTALRIAARMGIVDPRVIITLTPTPKAQP